MELECYFKICETCLIFRNTIAFYSARRKCRPPLWTRCSHQRCDLAGRVAVDNYRRGNFMKSPSFFLLPVYTAEKEKKNKGLLTVERDRHSSRSASSFGAPTHGATASSFSPACLLAMKASCSLLSSAISLWNRELIPRQCGGYVL